MSRELFVYWQADASLADAAVHAVRRFHDALRSSHPTVHAALYRRADAAGAGAGIVTLMEVYRNSPRLDDTLQNALLAAAHAALSELAHGERHVEVFERLSD